MFHNGGIQPVSPIRQIGLIYSIHSVYSHSSLNAPVQLRHAGSETHASRHSHAAENPTIPSYFYGTDRIWTKPKYFYSWMTRMFIVHTTYVYRAFNVTHFQKFVLSYCLDELVERSGPNRHKNPLSHFSRAGRVKIDQVGGAGWR